MVLYNYKPRDDYEGTTIGILPNKLVWPECIQHIASLIDHIKPVIKRDADQGSNQHSRPSRSAPATSPSQTTDMARCFQSQLRTEMDIISKIRKDDPSLKQEYFYIWPSAFVIDLIAPIYSIFSNRAVWYLVVPPTNIFRPHSTMKIVWCLGIITSIHFRL